MVCDWTHVVVALRRECERDAVRILLSSRQPLHRTTLPPRFRLGVKSAAIYTEHDTRALHVRCADEAVVLPAGSAGYLDPSAIVDLAKAVGVGTPEKN